jgi:alpha-galactosidase
MTKTILILAFLLFYGLKVTGQCEIIFDKQNDIFILKNNLFERKILIDKSNHAFYTTNFKDLTNGIDYCRKRSREFGFCLNGTTVFGGLDGRMVDYKSYEVKTAGNGSKTLQVDLSGRGKSIVEGIDFTVFYEIYPDLPMVRKWVSIKNNTSKDITLTNPEWEIVNLEICSPGWVPQICTYADVYGQYGQNVYKAPYTGRTDDPAILVYDYSNDYGAVIGNEAPGILKRTSVFDDSTRISIGLGFSGESFSFEATLKNGESFVTPKGFIILYHGSIWQNAFEGHLADFTRKYMGVRLFQREQSPVFMYNTWIPFRTKINDKLIREIADVASRAGVEYLVIDDGWQTNYGDWDVNKEKFPNGLKPVCDYIISKGMKPGFWISISTANDTSRVAKEHPDWFVKDKYGNIANLHGDYLKGQHTMNLSTPYYDYIKDKISYYVETCHLGYVKLDLAAVYSAYKLNYEEVGDYTTANRNHKSKNESIYLLYSRIYQLIDELKAKFPGLYIDCTYELYGKVFGVDYSLIQHADGDWLSNIMEEVPEGSLYMRQLCFERARVIPPSTMLIGNLKMEEARSDLNFQSLLSATPMMLGDPRKLTEERIKWFKEWSDWAREMEKKYNYTRFYQTSDIFVKPELHGWDGCARINTEKGGGILCFYRNESSEKSRIFPIIWVDENSEYKISSATSKKTVGIFSGKTLKYEGLKVEIPGRNSSEIMEIEKVR